MIERNYVRDSYDEYLNFGWRYTGQMRTSGPTHHHHYYEIERDTRIDNYKVLSKLEKKFFDLKSKIKSEIKVNKGTAFLLFLLLIIPGILYLYGVKAINNSRRKKNGKINEEMNEIINKARTLLH